MLTTRVTRHRNAPGVCRQPLGSNIYHEDHVTGQRALNMPERIVLTPDKDDAN
jgi:hypothetical protein